jgi:hypothetical protein
MELPSRDKARAKCIEAIKLAAKRSSLDCSLWCDEALNELAEIVFDSLDLVAHVNPIEVTEEMEDSARHIPLIGLEMGRSFPELTYRLAIFDAMATAGRLTNPPKKSYDKSNK